MVSIFNRFANIEDSCIKNKQKFLWFSYFGSHDYRLTYIGKFMSCSEDFETTVKCKLCGCKSQRAFVSYNELLRVGFKPEFLDKIVEPFFDSVYEDEIKEHLKEEVF